MTTTAPDGAPDDALGTPNSDPEPTDPADEATLTESPSSSAGTGSAAGSSAPEVSGGLSVRLRAVHPSTWLFSLAVVATVPLVLFRYGRHQWFLRDEWFLLTDNEGFPPLFEPSAGAHLVIIPRIIYRLFWAIWGINTYRPYAIANLVLHLMIVVLLRALMRRSGINPWLATAAAVPMLLFGPGHEGILLAFQVGFTGSVAWGLLQLLLADVEGDRIVRRDWYALGAGLLAITSSGIGVTTTFMVGLALLIRRGWKSAGFQTVPLGIAYLVWMTVEHVESTGPLGKPPLSAVYSWDREAIRVTIMRLGYFRLLAFFYIAMVVVAAIAIIGPWRDRTFAELRKDLAMPVAMAVTVLFFATTTSLGRWWVGPSGAGMSRYVYLQAALTLPLLAAAAQIISRRWTPAMPMFAALLLLPIPFNLRPFDSMPFNQQYYENRKYILSTAIRMPFAREVPPGVRPVPDPFDGYGLTIGYLLQAEKEGRLKPSTMPIDSMIENEFKVRLGFAQDLDGASKLGHTDCRRGRSIDIAPAKGDTFVIDRDVQVQLLDRKGGSPVSLPIAFYPDAPFPDKGMHISITLPDLAFRITAPGGEPLQLCNPLGQ